MIIGIDMGHTLSGIGTGASNLLSETQCNREVGSLVMKYLQAQGHKVINCTVDVSSNDLSDRVAKANAQSMDLFVSIHLNAGGGHGTESYIYNGNFPSKNENRAIAQRINDAIVTDLGTKNRGVKEANFYVLRGTICNAVLLELCFVDSQEDKNKYNADKFAKAIVRGITGVSVNTPSTDNGNTSSNGDYLNLNPHMTKWAVYPTNVTPVKGNECGNLAPSKFGGLSYKILGNPQSDVYTIETSSFGKVNIFAPKDNDSSITSTPKYGNTTTNKEYLNLNPHMNSWAIYPTHLTPIRGNECGHLAPSKFGGLSYEIKSKPQADVYTIETSSFGKVNIFAPKDNDSSITNYPVY